VRAELVVPPLDLSLNPLLPSTDQVVRTAPVWLRVLVADRSCAVVEGPRRDTGEGVAWLATDRALVQQACDLWEATCAVSTLVEPQQRLTRRQFEIARAMCLGHKDARIARDLRISVRSVEREVNAILRFVGATSRCEAVLNMMGRGRNSGPRTPAEAS
jgi:DNA-binding CsgD family transcriptional regulator